MTTCFLQANAVNFIIQIYSLRIQLLLSVTLSKGCTTKTKLIVYNYKIFVGISGAQLKMQKSFYIKKVNYKIRYNTGMSYYDD